MVSEDFKKKHADIKPEGFMLGFATSFWYDLKADKSFEGSMSSGTYTVSGKTVAIKTTKLMGKDAPGVEMTGDLSADGKILTLHPPGQGILPAELAGGIEMSKS